MRVRSRLRVSVSRSIWSFCTPSMNSSRESSPGVERKGVMGKRVFSSPWYCTRAQSWRLARGTEPTPGEVFGKGSRQRSQKRKSSAEIPKIQLWLGQRGVEDAALTGPLGAALGLPASLPRSPYLLVAPPLVAHIPASSPSPLTSILENTVSVNSSALMVESLQGLMARMAWEGRSERTRPNRGSAVPEQRSV